ncbi:MAG TPA: NUDIX hydrolase [Nitrososphaeraceae archaeon]|jgi:ADP-ribose pyrophosphatase YjhB (NUDIX family)|nr:NUDIX hydrolase [Nitrososphaeraceae archaeon]
MSTSEEHSNPIPVVDVIIQQDSEILLARRKKEPFKGYLALPGGFVNIGETIEETALNIELTDILGVYSDPQRDPRGHIMSTVFIGRTTSNENNGANKAISQDDASELEWIDLQMTNNKMLALDHRIILSNYIKWKQSGGTFWSTKA